MHIEAVLVREVSEAAPTPVEGVRLHTIPHERWEGLEPSGVMLPVLEVDTLFVFLHRHVFRVAGPGLVIVEGIHVNVRLQLILERRHILDAYWVVHIIDFIYAEEGAVLMWSIGVVFEVDLLESG